MRTCLPRKKDVSHTLFGNDMPTHSPEVITVITTTTVIIQVLVACVCVIRELILWMLFQKHHPLKRLSV